MASHQFTAEQIINKLREADVERARGTTLKQVVRQLSITDKTYHRWRKEYGGLKVVQAKRMKEIEHENARLRRIVAHQALDIAILREAANSNL